MSSTLQQSPNAVPSAAGRAPDRGPRLQHTTTQALRTVLPLVVLLVALALYTDSQNPAFIRSGNIENILVQVAVLGILAAGQTFLLIGGQMDLSVGSLVSLVAVLAAKQFDAGWSTPAVVIFALALGALVGLVWGLVVAYLDVPPFILTLGGLSVLGSLALVASNNVPIRVQDGLNSWGFGQWFGLRAPAVMLIVVLVLAGLLLHFTRFGRTTYALGSSRPTAFLAGVPVKRHLVLLFVGNSTLAAFAGLVMMARLAAGDPRSGQGLELSVIAVTVLGGAALAGGRGTMIGTAVGVLVFGTISSSLTFLKVPGAYQSLVSGGILIVAVVVTAAADLRAARATGVRGSAAWRGLLGPLTRPSRRTAPPAEGA
ncbi:ABC transporter permease [Trujillonella humicola]|uniref:ABC transporter permease n=1 Tax=Trujillonella humicola TaxID=3383699 RepID=UPI00390591AD